MTSIQRQLQFVNRFVSYAQISVLTGVPSSTIGYVVRGERQLSHERKRVVRNLYQRTAYAQARAAGLSPTQARRFSWYRPERVTNVLQESRDIVGKIANSRFAAYKRSLQDRGLYVNDEQVMQTLRDAITVAISRSDMPLERLYSIEYSNTNEL